MAGQGNKLQKSFYGDQGGKGIGQQVLKVSL
jgi:hypothetical protein